MLDDPLNDFWVKQRREKIKNVKTNKMELQDTDLENFWSRGWAMLLEKTETGCSVSLEGCWYVRQTNRKGQCPPGPYILTAIHVHTVTPRV